MLASAFVSHGKFLRGLLPIRRNVVVIFGGFDAFAVLNVVVMINLVVVVVRCRDCMYVVFVVRLMR